MAVCCCRCTDIHSRRLTSFTTSTPGGSKDDALIVRQQVVVNSCRMCFYQGGVGAESSGGSERRAPTCIVGKARTAAGKAAEIISLLLFHLFLNSRCLSVEELDPGMICCWDVIVFHSAGSVYMQTASSAWFSVSVR